MERSIIRCWVLAITEYWSPVHNAAAVHSVPLTPEVLHLVQFTYVREISHDRLVLLPPRAQAPRPVQPIREQLLQNEASGPWIPQYVT